MAGTGVRFSGSRYQHYTPASQIGDAVNSYRARAVPFALDVPLARVFSSIGVPLNPNCLRIWFIKNRSCEKCSAGPRLVNTMNSGGRIDDCVM